MNIKKITYENEMNIHFLALTDDKNGTFYMGRLKSMSSLLRVSIDLTLGIQNAGLLDVCKSFYLHMLYIQSAACF